MRRLLHVLLSIALWVVFVYYWDIVTRDAIGPGTRLAMKVVSALLAFGTLLTFWWIAHNRRLGRRDRRRTPRAVAPDTLAADALGRPIDRPPLDELRAAPMVEIAVNGDRKGYAVVAPGGSAGGA